MVDVAELFFQKLKLAILFLIEGRIGQTLGEGGLTSFECFNKARQFIELLLFPIQELAPLLDFRRLRRLEERYSVTMPSPSKTKVLVTTLSRKARSWETSRRVPS